MGMQLSNQLSEQETGSWSLEWFEIYPEKVKMKYEYMEYQTVRYVIYCDVLMLWQCPYSCLLLSLQSTW